MPKLKIWSGDKIKCHKPDDRIGVGDIFEVLECQPYIPISESMTYRCCLRLQGAAPKQTFYWLVGSRNFSKVQPPRITKKEMSTAVQLPDHSELEKFLGF